MKFDHWKKYKKQNQKIVMATAYDYPTAKLIETAGLDAILVGDSLANVVLGLDKTTEVNQSDMLRHLGAVCRGIEEIPVIVDLSFEAYQTNQSDVVSNARELIDAGADAVKVEWFDGCLDVVKKLNENGILVMGHVGLTPQTAKDYKVQGRTSESAQAIVQQTHELEKNGCFSIVLECVPKQLASFVTQSLEIPTIGIGAGNKCDGQILVFHDIVGLSFGHRPKFVKQYTDLSTIITDALNQFKDDVKSSNFPSDEESYL